MFDVAILMCGLTWAHAPSNTFEARGTTLTGCGPAVGDSALRGALALAGARAGDADWFQNRVAAPGGMRGGRKATRYRQVVQGGHGRS